MFQIKGITKRFAGVTALDQVTLELPEGKTTALIGENGAGKSTLMKILSGVYQDFEGELLFKGNPVRFANPGEAQDSGIAIIHQELNLIPQLSVTENIFLGREILNKWGWLDKAAMRKKTTELLRRLTLNVDPDTPVQQLKVGQQQVVEIAKALLLDAEVIIMDEPTSAISDHEVEALFRLIDNLKSSGKTLVYISHKLDELFRIADRYVILRDGRTVDSGEMKEADQDRIIHMMAGRNIRAVPKAGQPCQDRVLLSVNGLRLKHPYRESSLLKDISFTLRAGEVLGIFGLMGAGRTELLETLFGLHARRANGRIMIDGREVRLRTPSDAINAGLALVPEDRKKDGLALGMDVKSNISMSCLATMEEFGLINGRKEMALASKYITGLRIKTASQTQLARNLSGGNQQKVVLAKWLASHPKALMLDEPTRGIDVNAKNEIYKLILELAGSGLGLIIASSELPEILTVASRVLVMSEGRLTADFPIADATEDKIMKAAIPKSI